MTQVNIGPITAYGLAKANGFSGTMEEWLASLSQGSLPEVSVLDNGKVMQVANGEWATQKANLDEDTLKPISNMDILTITAD